MAICPNCGKELPDGALFCTGCGTKLEAQSAPAPVEQAAPMPAEQPAPAPVEQAIPVPVEPAVPAPAEQPAPVSAEQVIPVPVEQAAPVFAEQPVSAPQPVQPEYVPQQPVQPVQAEFNPAMQPQPGMQQPYMQPMAAAPVGAAPMAAQPKPKKKVPLGLIIGLACGGVAVLALAFTAIWFFLLRPVKIDLNPYIEFKAEGYNTIGTSSVDFDKASFEQDYGEKIRKKARRGLNFGQSAPTQDPVYEFVDEIINYSASKTKGLSNGDTVEVTWNCDDVMAKQKYNCTLTYNNQEFTVSGLKDADILNPFDYVEAHFGGIAPQAYINLEIDDSEEAMNYVDFTTEAIGTDSDYLNIGDTVTVKASYNEDWMLENYGVVFEPREKTYTVQGVPRYISSVSEIPSNVVSGLNDAVAADYEKNFNSNRKLVNEVTPLGIILLSNKDPKSPFEQNKIYFVYRVNIQPTKGAAFDAFSVLQYYGETVDDNGTVSINPSAHLSFHGERHDFSGGWYRGYESFEELYDDLTTNDALSYNIESTVEIDVDPDADI